MDLDTCGIGAGKHNMIKDAEEITQYDRLYSVISKLLKDHEALNAT